MIIAYKRDWHMEKVKNFIIDYIQREYTITDDTDIMKLNYVESGYIDSIGLIQFIAVLEDEFGISFTDDELTDPRIFVVGELISMIVSKMEAETN